MNQILSIEMPKSNSKKTTNRSRGNKKASTKSVITFFCIMLLIFGIAMVGLGIYSILNNKKENRQIQPTSESDKPRIDISQNASELDVEISSQNEISKIQYKWNDGEVTEEQGNGEETVNLTVKIPSGTNTFNIKAIDINGIESEYSHEYVYGGTENDEPNANLSFDADANKLKIVCNEQQKITNIVYHYDNEQEVTTEINDIDGQVEIPIKQGEHNLTVKVSYEDGTSKQMSKKVYFPIVERVQPTEDRNGLVLKASDKRKITKVKINFNGEELPEEEVNSEKFEKTLQLKEGENKLILTVYNSDGVSITTRTKCVKNN